MLTRSKTEVCSRITVLGSGSCSTAGILGSVVLSAVSSVVVTRWFLGSESLFRIPAVQLEHPSELIAYSVLGVAGGFAASN